MPGIGLNGSITYNGQLQIQNRSTHLRVDVSDSDALLGVEALVHVWVAEVLFADEGGVIGCPLVGLSRLLLHLLEEVFLLEADGARHPLSQVNLNHVVLGRTES